jgi:hypothetical protein
MFPPVFVAHGRGEIVDRGLAVLHRHDRQAHGRRREHALHQKGVILVVLHQQDDAVVPRPLIIPPMIPVPESSAGFCSGASEGANLSPFSRCGVHPIGRGAAAAYS